MLHVHLRCWVLPRDRDLCSDFLPLEAVFEILEDKVLSADFGVLRSDCLCVLDILSTGE